MSTALFVLGVAAMLTAVALDTWGTRPHCAALFIGGLLLCVSVVLQ